MGFMSAFCIHPIQVSVLNEVFEINQKEVDEAIMIIKAFKHASAQKLGAVEVNGKMVDLLVFERARETLARANEYGNENTIVNL